MMTNLSARFAISGRCSQIWIPGTFVEIGLKRLRNFGSASGLGSNESIWLMPPESQKWITDISRFGVAAGVCARRRRTSPQESSPNVLSEPTRRNERRLKFSILVVVQELFGIEDGPEQIFHGLLAALPAFVADRRQRELDFLLVRRPYQCCIEDAAYDVFIAEERVLNQPF